MGCVRVLKCTTPERLPRRDEGHLPDAGICVKKIRAFAMW
jgi:hypothetical protein